jgi:hypothetical protein
MASNQKDKTAANRVARHTERMQKMGFVRAHPWVHSKDLEKLLKYAERLRANRLKD